mgnify:CR=1 FL=1
MCGISPKKMLLENEKALVAKEALQFIKNGMTIGLGTGSTARYFIQFLAEKVKNGLKIQAVASSTDSEALARSQHIPIISFSEVRQIDLYVDGTDRFDSDLNLIKGGGGALLREKILAFNSKKTLIIADESKYSNPLFGFPLAIEILPFAHPLTIEKILNSGYEGTLRKGYLTDNGNLIFDIHLKKPIQDPGQFNDQLHAIPGVMETGLFIGLATQVLMAQKDGNIKTFTRSLNDA